MCFVPIAAGVEWLRAHSVQLSSTGGVAFSTFGWCSNFTGVAGVILKISLEKQFLLIIKNNEMSIIPLCFFFLLFLPSLFK
jgi:hypothetical protein